LVWKVTTDEAPELVFEEDVLIVLDWATEGEPTVEPVITLELDWKAAKGFEIGVIGGEVYCGGLSFL
jgi:hypothetical protein